MPKSGGEHPNAKLTDADVQRIRTNAEGKSDYALAKELGCDRSTVRLIRLNAQRHDPDYTPVDRGHLVGRPRKDGQPPQMKAEAPRNAEATS